MYAVKYSCRIHTLGDGERGPHTVAKIASNYSRSYGAERYEHTLKNSMSHNTRYMHSVRWLPTNGIYFILANRIGVGEYQTISSNSGIVGLIIIIWLPTACRSKYFWHWRLYMVRLKHKHFKINLDRYKFLLFSSSVRSVDGHEVEIGWDIHHSEWQQIL